MASRLGRQLAVVVATPDCDVDYPASKAVMTATSLQATGTTMSSARKVPTRLLATSAAKVINACAVDNSISSRTDAVRVCTAASISITSTVIAAQSGWPCSSCCLCESLILCTCNGMELTDGR